MTNKNNNNNNYDNLKTAIQQINKLVAEKNTKNIDQKAVDDYLDNFRQIFKLSAERVKSAGSEDERKAAIGDLVQINGLYGIQHVLNLDLPADLEEIAYDYDHDDYPGYEYRLNNILRGNYMVLGGGGHSSWCPNSTGVIKANIEVNGVSKTSSMFPVSYDADEVVSSIREAWATRVPDPDDAFAYMGTTLDGLTIRLVETSPGSGTLRTAYPES